MEKFINTGNKDTRSGFGAGLTELGRTNDKVVALCADLTGSLKMNTFAKEHPDRFFQCGIAEADMIDVAAGLSLSGRIPFAGSFADGATHQVMEDIGMMRMLPRMTVINPCDYNQTKAATIAAASYEGPVYLRFGRPSVPNFTPEDQVFEIGKALKLVEGKEVTVFATGHLVWEALLAAEELEKQGISAEVIDIHTIKPLDTAAVIASVAKTGAVVTAEEHLIAGGLGELIAGVLIRTAPCPMEFVAVDDLFGQSGKPAELMKEYGLDAGHIVSAALKAVSRKN